MVDLWASVLIMNFPEIIRMLLKRQVLIFWLISYVSNIEQGFFDILYDFQLICTNNKLRVFLLLPVCVCAFTSIHREGLICLDQLECKGTDEPCCAEDVSFVCQVRSSLL